MLGLGSTLSSSEEKKTMAYTAMQQLVKYYANSIPEVRSWARRVGRNGQGLALRSDALDHVFSPGGGARYFLRAEAPDGVRYMSVEYSRPRCRVSHWAAYMAEEEINGCIRNVFYAAYLK
jgi:hypothetical protein